MDTTTGQDVYQVKIETFSYDQSSGVIIAKVKLPNLALVIGSGSDANPLSHMMGLFVTFIGKEMPDPVYKIIEVHTRSTDNFFSKGQAVVLLTCEPAIIMDEDEVDYSDDELLETLDKVINFVIALRERLIDGSQNQS